MTTDIPCQPSSPLDGNTGDRTGPPAHCCCQWRDTEGCSPHCTTPSQNLSCSFSLCCKEQNHCRCGNHYCNAVLHSAIVLFNYRYMRKMIGWKENGLQISSIRLQYLIVFIVVSNGERVGHLRDGHDTIHVLLFVKNFVFLLFDLKLSSNF